MAEILFEIWAMFEENGYHVFNTFVSFADIFVFVIFGSLFIWFIGKLLGGE